MTVRRSMLVGALPLVVGVATAMAATGGATAPLATGGATAPQGDFRPSLEPILMIMGGLMTLVVGAFLVWLVRQMLREDRQARANGDYDDRSGA